MTSPNPAAFAGVNAITDSEFIYCGFITMAPAMEIYPGQFVIQNLLEVFILV